MPLHPKISIITVCKNTGKFLGECLESILSQDYDNFECIIQDSESSDETPQIIEAYVNRFPQIVQAYIEKDSGIGDGMNRALKHATGDIIGILLSDERYRPGALQWAAAAFAKHPEAAVVYGDYYSVDSKYQILKLNRPGAFTYEEILCSSKVVPCPAAFIRSSSLKDEGYFADSKMTTCPDFELWTRLGLKHPILYVPGVVSENMVHEESSTFCPETYPRFVELKMYVLNKIMDAPETPQKIKQLEPRAKAGLYRWAGDSVYHRDRRQAFKWYAKSLSTQVSLKIILRCAAVLLPKQAVAALQKKDLRARMHEAVLSLYRKYQKKNAKERNLEGDRDIEWSFIAAHIPEGKGKALDFGSGGSSLGLVAARRGYEVLSADLRDLELPYSDARIQFRQGDALEMGLEESGLNLIINCSTIEHVGLAGRYGIENLDANADFQAMKNLRKLLRPEARMLLTLPVGLDAVFPPICRVYGKQRLPQLLEGYDVEHEEYWVKDEKNKWVQSSKEEALSFNASMDSWEALKNVCALGCFVLKKSKVESLQKL